MPPLPSLFVLIRDVVIPHAQFFTLLLIVFQLAVAFCILSRGSLVTPGLIASAIFAFLAAFASNTPGAIGNVVLAAMQLYLALSR